MENKPDFFQAAAATPPQITDEAEACTAVLLACVHSDELGMGRQSGVFDAAVRSRNVFGGRDPEALIERAEQYFEQAGSPAALIDAAIGAIRAQTRLPLFYHCLDVILANGVVTPQEDRIFKYLKGKFKIEDELAWQALEVLTVKNQL